MKADSFCSSGLTQAQWDKLAALGGVDWLRRQIRYARLNKEKQ